MTLNPLQPVPGEIIFVPPVAVREACRKALEREGSARVGGFAAQIAAHVANGEPLGQSGAEKLLHCLDEAKGEVGKSGGEAIALTVEMFGGEASEAWLREALGKADADSGADAAAAAPGKGVGKSAVASGGKDTTAQSAEKVTANKIVKVDEALGIVFGWAIVCKQDGVEYFDSQDDHIPEAAMIEAATDFMIHSRVLGDMHQKAEGGSVVYCFPMTEDIGAAFGFQTQTTGLMIGVKPQTADVLEKFKTGEYTGFSIGGRRIMDEEVE